VFPHTAQVLAINDQTSGAGVILEMTRIRGVLKGNASGQLEIVGVIADQRIKPGEKVLTAGGDMIFPRGLPAGTVQKVIPDPDRDAFIDILIAPAAHLDQLDEVLVITSTDPKFPGQAQKDIATSEDLKGSEAEAIREQMKASEIMAERLPGLNAPTATTETGPAINGLQPGAANQTATPGAGQTTSPAPAPKLLQPAHPDRFSPGAAPAAGSQAAPAPPQQSAPAPAKPKVPQVTKPAGQPAVPAPAGQPKPGQPDGPGRTQ
jgi:rod shape-determining protein MreC